MKLTYFFVFIFFIGLSNNIWAEDEASPQDVIKKIREATNFLAEKGETGLESFNEKNGPWVFKNTYVFVFDCVKGTIVAHPIRPKLIGKNLMGLKDIKGNYFFAQLCACSQNPQGGWVEYWWPEVDSAVPSRKVSLMVQVPNMPYQVGGGIYDESKSIEELERLLLISE